MSLLQGISPQAAWSQGERFFTAFFSNVRYARSVNDDEEPQPLYEKKVEATDDQDNSPSYYSTNNRLQDNSSYSTSNDVKSLIPLPDWPVALTRWGLCWDFHIYGFSVLFLILTLISAAIFLRFRLRVQRFKIVFNTLVLLAASGVFRAVFMLVDPYGYKGRMAGLMVGIMTQAVYPLFCACYGLTQVMLLRITNIDVGHSRIRTLSCLLGCTLSYLFLVVVIETLVFYERSLKLLLLVDSGCFIAWSLCLGITFICSGFRLTQYASETKRARKELNAFSNHRRSTSNNTGLSAISSATNDTNINVFNVDFTPTSSDLPSFTTSIASSETVQAEMAISTSSSANLSSLPVSNHRPNTTVRLSRPKLKISDNDHMTITIASEDDGESTSSTDADNPQNDIMHRPSRRTKKRYKQKHTRLRSRSGSKTPTTPSVYSPVSGTDEIASSSATTKSSSTTLKRRKSGSDSANAKMYNMSPISPSTSAVENKDAKHKTGTNTVDSCNRSQPMDNSQSYATASELPLLASSLIQQSKHKKESIYNEDSLDNDSQNDYDDEDGESVYKDMSHLANYCQNRESGSKNELDGEKYQGNALSFGMGIDLVFNENKNKNGHQVLQDSQISDHISDGLSPVDSTPYSTPVDNDQISSSTRENGYLADTENIFSCSSFSRLSNSLQRQPVAHEDNDRLSCDASSQRSTSSHSDDGSTTTSPGLSERVRPNMSTSLGLFRIRQSKVVQRAVHLTYFLTFLFMFACLLQLYTVFGVYGVLGTIPRPDPWPWLIFHTIFRATEVSIGFTIAVLAYITLNHRHQRAKRRHQQQQHLEATRDCIV